MLPLFPFFPHLYRKSLKIRNATELFPLVNVYREPRCQAAVQFEFVLCGFNAT